VNSRAALRPHYGARLGQYEGELHVVPAEPGLTLSRRNLDVTRCQLDPLLPAEQCQEDEHTLVRPLAGIESELSLQWSCQNPHAIARARPRKLRQFHQPAPLPRSNFIDHAVRDARRPAAVHDEVDHTGGPPRSVPLQLDRDEGVPRKERWPELDPTSVADTPIPQPRVIRLVTGKRQAMERQGLAMALQASGAPIGHSSARPERVARALATARGILAKGRRRNQLARPPIQVPRLPDSRIRRRMEEGAPDVTQRPVSNPLAAAPDQRAFSRSTKRSTIARLERGS